VSKAKPVIVSPVIVEAKQKLTLDDTSIFPLFFNTGNVKKQVHSNWTKDTSSLKQIPERHVSLPSVEKQQEKMLSLSIGGSKFPSLSIPKMRDNVLRRSPSPTKQSPSKSVVDDWVQKNIAYLEEEYEKSPGHWSFEEFALSSYNLAQGHGHFSSSNHEKFEPFEEEEEEDDYDEIPYEEVEDEEEEEDEY
jgi:hypothetical protein